jgi:hypothetical protein
LQVSQPEDVDINLILLDFDLFRNGLLILNPLLLVFKGEVLIYDGKRDKYFPLSGATGSHPHRVPGGVWYLNGVSFCRFINIDYAASYVVVGHRVLVIDVQDERWQVCLTAIGLNYWHMQILLEDWVIIVFNDVGFDLYIASLSQLAPHNHKWV